MKKGELTRQRIIDAAADLFMRNGFEETTFGDIAKRVSLTQPALYTYFDNKMEILKSAALNAADFGSKKTATSIDPDSGAQEKMYQYIRSNIEFYHQHKSHGHCLVSLYFFASSSPEMKEIFLSIQNAGISKIANFLSLREHEIQKPIKNKLLIASQIHSFMVGEIYKQFYSPEEMTPSVRANSIWAAVKKSFF